MLHMIKAIDAADLLIQTTEQLARGRDLYTPLFVSHEGLLCQRMITSLCIYEYRLIIAKDLNDLSNQEANAIDMGFDYAFNTVLWNAKYLQWMSRMNSAALTVRDAVTRLSAEQAAALFENAARGDELRLVEDVREGLQMEPTSNGGYVVQVPFPVKFS